MKASRNVVQTALAAVVSGVLLLGACAPAAPAPTPKPAPAPTVAPAAPAAPRAAPTVAPATPAAPRAAPTAAPPPAAKPAVEKPRYGGILKVGHNTSPAGYDSHIHFGGESYVVNPFYNGLLWLDPTSPLESKILPDLAQRWEISPDGLVYTFYLHKGVKFHDGTPLTAKDVIFSYNKILNPPKGIRISTVKGALVAVKEVQAPDDYTVKITLKYPSGSFLDRVADPHVLVFPKDYVEKGGYWEGNNLIDKKPLGSGPFMLKEHLRGISVEAVKNPHYFKAGLPYLDGYIFYVIPDDATRLASLRTERIHTMPYPFFAKPSGEAILKREMGARLVTWRYMSESSYAVFTLNQKRKPFDDLRVRQAIRMALNNEEFMQFVYEGLGAAVGPIAGPYWALPKEELQKYPGFEPNYEARLAEAKKLLAEAGYPDGFEMKVIGVGARWYNMGAMEYGASALKRIGIKVKLEPQEVGAFLNNLVVGNFDSAGSLHGAPEGGDPDAIFGGFYTSWGGRNYAHYSNPKIDELYEKQTREMDPAQRREIVWEMQRILLADVAWPMFGVRGYFANRLAFVRGGEFAGAKNHFNTRYETIWLAE